MKGEIQFWGQTHTHTLYICTSRAASSQLKRNSFIFFTHRKSIFEYPCLPSDQTTIQTVGDELLEKHFQTNKSPIEMDLSN